MREVGVNKCLGRARSALPSVASVHIAAHNRRRWRRQRWGRYGGRSRRRHRRARQVVIVVDGGVGSQLDLRPHNGAVYDRVDLDFGLRCVQQACERALSLDMYLTRIRDDELQILRSSVKIHCATDAEAPGHENSNISCRRNTNFRRPIQIDAGSDIVSGMQCNALVLPVEMQSARNLRPQRERNRDRRHGYIRQPRGGMFDQGALDDATLDDHGRRADGSVVPDVGASVRTEGRVVGINEGMFRGNDATGIGDHCVSPGWARNHGIARAGKAGDCGARQPYQ